MDMERGSERASYHRHGARRAGARRAAGAVLLCLLTLPGAGLPALAGDLERQRAAFLAAERALQAGERESYRRGLEALRDYPLYPYLLYADLTARLDRADPQAVNAFLDTHGEPPLGPRLRRRWVHFLAEAKRWPELIAAYRPGLGTAARCHHLRALLETGARDAALARVEDLWLVGFSRPEACDFVFDAWRAAGRLTPALAWARFRLALDDDNPRLARYLSRYLAAADRARADAWRRAHGDPERVLAAFAAGTERGADEALIAYALERLARREPQRAADALEAVQRRAPLEAASLARVKRRIGLSFAYKHRTEAVQWLAEVGPEHGDARSREWRALSAVRHGRREALIEALDALPADEREEERWRYWRARALEALDRPAAAQALYRTLARERSYHGFLAADRLGLDYRMGDRPLDIPPAELETVGRLAGIRRARELLALDRIGPARSEWYYATRDLDADDRARAAKLAQGWGWHDRAILTLAGTGRLDDLSLRFPIAFAGRVEAESGARGLEPAWVFAVIRQESAFAPEARSHAGALGLMQIMPPTGRRIARELQVRLSGDHQLLQAPTNIRFGATYLRMMLDELHDHPALATAAYNAGPHRVRRWLPEDAEMDPEAWIETIPFGETRRYVQRVLSYTAVYEHRLGAKPRRLSERLRPVPPDQKRLATGAGARGG